MSWLLTHPLVLLPFLVGVLCIVVSCLVLAVALLSGLRASRRQNRGQVRLSAPADSPRVLRFPSEKMRSYRG